MPKKTKRPDPLGINEDPPTRMSAQYESPSEYIGHHLTFYTKQVGDGAFWTLNVDTLVVSFILGVIGLAFFRWVAAATTLGGPNKTQAFLWWVFWFRTRPVRGLY